MKKVMHDTILIHLIMVETTNRMFQILGEVG